MGIDSKIFISIYFNRGHDKYDEIIAIDTAKSLRWSGKVPTAEQMVTFKTSHSTAINRQVYY